MNVISDWSDCSPGPTSVTVAMPTIIGGYPHIAMDMTAQKINGKASIASHTVVVPSDNISPVSVLVVMPPKAWRDYRKLRNIRIILGR